MILKEKENEIIPLLSYLILFFLLYFSFKGMAPKTSLFDSLRKKHILVKTQLFNNCNDSIGLEEDQQQLYSFSICTIQSTAVNKGWCSLCFDNQHVLLTANGLLILYYIFVDIHCKIASLCISFDSKIIKTGEEISRFLHANHVFWLITKKLPSLPKSTEI